MCPCRQMWSHSALWFLHVKKPSNGNKLVCSSTSPGEACRFWPLWMMWWISVCLVGIVLLVHRKGGTSATWSISMQYTQVISPKHVFYRSALIICSKYLSHKVIDFDTQVMRSYEVAPNLTCFNALISICDAWRYIYINGKIQRL